jgi:photosystem II stability/assembly factor-like uncharacterized protein
MQVRSLFLIVVSLCFGVHIVNSQVQPSESKLLPVHTSIRGMSVVDDSVAWISGSDGWIGRSINGGKDWEMHLVTGFEKSQFRSIYAFDKNKAVIASAGAPAVILMTSDGGISWTTVYSNPDTLAFLDGIDFRNAEQGIAYGDPINGRMMILRTNDGGMHWTEAIETSRPLLMEGESSFAASGTGIRMFGKQEILIATGGMISRLFYSADDGKSWKALNPHFVHGKASTGIFSVAVYGETINIVGGDYLTDTMRTDHVSYSADKGKTWFAPKAPTRGYRECVEYLNSKTLMAAGPMGMDISYDNGLNWSAFSEETGFHVVRKSRTGKLVVAAGKDRVMIVKP